MEVETFDEARARYVTAAAVAFGKLTRIVSDKDWCNVEFPPFKEALNDLQLCCRAIARLNESQMSAGRLDKQ